MEPEPRPGVVGRVSRFGLLAPLRLRDFRCLWVGMTVSLLGDGVTLIAISWQVYELSDAPTALSVVGVAMTVPHVVLLLAGGVVSDRFDRRRVMIAADVIRGLAVGTLGVLALSGALELWHVWVIAAAYGAGTAFFGPAFDAIVPDLVPADMLAQANSLDQFVRPAMYRLAGPAIGGLLIGGFGTGIAFLLDAGTFAASIVAVAMMRPQAVRGGRETDTSAWQEVREGFRYVRSKVWLWGTFVAATFAYLLFWGPQEVLLPHLVKYELGGTATDLGLVLAMGGVGAILAAVVVGSRGIPRRFITFMYLCWTLSTLAVAGYGLARFSWQVTAACFLFNSLEAAGTIAWTTTKHRFVPGRLLGRVSSLDWFISIGLLPVSFALAGPVAQAIGERATLTWAGVLGSVMTLAFLFLPGMRDLERDGSAGVPGASPGVPGPAAEPAAEEGPLVA